MMQETKSTINRNLKRVGKVLLKFSGGFVLIRHGCCFHHCHPCHLMKVNHNETSYQMGGNDSTTKSSTAVTKRKTNTEQVPMLNCMFEIDISVDESDNKYTQETQNESAVTDPEIQNNQESMEEQDEVEHASAMPLFEGSEEETVDSRHEVPAERHIKEEFVKEELQLNQEVV